MRLFLHLFGGAPLAAGLLCVKALASPPSPPDPEGATALPPAVPVGRASDLDLDALRSA